MDSRHHQANYYYSGASSKDYSPRRDDEDGKESRQWMTPCLWILAILFILIIIIIIVCLIIFFTWGPTKAELTGAIVDTQKVKTFNAVDPETVALPPKTLQLESDKPNFVTAADDVISHHFDLDLPVNVLNALDRGEPKICLFDTAVDSPQSGASYRPTSGRLQYVEEHISSAKHFDILKVVTFKDKGIVELSHPLEFQQYCRSLGIDNDCQVILYDRAQPRGSIASATFVWWLFKLYGHSKVTVMNGGLPAWKSIVRNGEKITKGEDYGLIQNKGDFTAEWRPSYIADYTDLEKGLSEKLYRLIDSRTQEEFSSFTKSSFANDFGRIKSSTNVPLGADILSDDLGSIKNIQDIKSGLKTKNLDPLANYVVYGNTPLNGSVVHFALSQLGYDVKLYCGGWIEWSYRASSGMKEKPSRLSKFVSRI